MQTEVLKTEELIETIGEENAIAVADWLERVAEEFGQARPAEIETTEFLEYLSEHLRLTATEDRQPNSGELAATDVMDL
ncbi:MAG TPA: hypothetical protein V6C65_16380 [Allocoleopsis sp.]